MANSPVAWYALVKPFAAVPSGRVFVTEDTVRAPVDASDLTVMSTIIGRASYFIPFVLLATVSFMRYRYVPAFGNTNPSIVDAAVAPLDGFVNVPFLFACGSVDSAVSLSMFPFATGVTV